MSLLYSWDLMDADLLPGLKPAVFLPGHMLGIVLEEQPPLLLSMGLSLPSANVFLHPKQLSH